MLLINKKGLVIRMKELAPHCVDYKLHPSRMVRAEELMPREDALFALADLYKIFGDSTRLRILYLLYDTELCVCDIAGLLGMQISAISHQLRVLKQARLVKFRRAGKTVFYSLADDHIHAILQQGMDHVTE